VKRGQAALRLKRGHETARTHPWIFKGDVADVSEVEPGSAVTVIDSAGHFVGRGLYNPRPALCCRILSAASITRAPPSAAASSPGPTSRSTSPSSDAASRAP